MKKIKSLITIVLVMFMTIGFVGCGDGKSDIYFYVEGTLVATVRTGGEEIITLPSEPEKEGYFFDGWYFDNTTFTKRLTALKYQNEKLMESVNVYAKFIKSHNLLLETNGGTFVDENQKDSYETGKINSEIEIEKEGKTFGGWYTNSDCLGEAVEFPYTLNSDTTLYAKWKEETYCKVNFYKKDGETLVENGEKKFLEESTAEAMEAPREIGYNFVCWLDKDTGEEFDFATALYKHYNLVAKYEEKFFTVEFLNENNVVIETKTIQEGKTVEKIDAPAKEGHTFNCWIGEDNEEFDFSTLIMGDTKITTKYDINIMTVKFVIEVPIEELEETGEEAIDEDEETPEIDSDQEEDTEVVEKTNIIEKTIKLNWNTVILTKDIPSVPSKVGHTHDGWKDRLTGERFDITSPVKRDLELEPIYKPDTMTITFELNEKEEPYAIRTLDYGTILSGENIPEEPEKEGHTFLYWVDISTGEEFLLEETKITKNIELRAKFEINVMNVKFVVDGEESEIKLDWGTVIPEKDIPEIPTKIGYTFKYWIDKKTNEKFELKITEIKEDKVIETKYEANKYTITFDYNGADKNIGDATKEVTFDKIIGELPKPFKTKFLFQYWQLIGDVQSVDGKLVEGSEIYDDLIYKFNGDITLKAYFIDDPTRSYTIKHYQESLEGNYVLYETDDTKRGEYGTLTSAIANNYIGFEAQEFDQQEILENETTVVEIYYNRKSYTIIWKNEGEEIYSVIKKFGSTLNYPGEKPTKAPDEMYTYTFAGWDSNPETVDGDKTFNAVYTKEYIEYKVEFINWDDSVISFNYYHYDDKVIVPADPVRPSDESYNYTFAGWGEITKVKGNTTYRATFSQEWIEYTVQFLNYDGKSNTIVQETKKLHYGDKLLAPEENPIRASDLIYDYVFRSWGITVKDKDTNEEKMVDVTIDENTTVTGNMIFEAQYDEIFIEYVVSFKDYDGTVIFEDTNSYHYDDLIKLPTKDSSPTREQDKKFIYDFYGWTQYNQEIEEGDQYVDVKNLELSSIMIRYGDTILGKEFLLVNDPDLKIYKSYEATKYEFNLNVDKVQIENKTEVTFYAYYLKTYVEYTIRFFDSEGNEIYKNEKCHYGDDLVFTGTNPTKASDATYNYTFAGWYPEEATVQGHRDYHPTFSKEYINYTIKFINYNNLVLSEKTYHYGDVIKFIPEDPTRDTDMVGSYTFRGWGKKVGLAEEVEEIILNKTTVQGNKTYTALYDIDYKNYTVSFLNYNLSIISTRNDYHYGDPVEVPLITPSRAPDYRFTYTFAGWKEGAVTTVNGNKNYTATYTETYRNYTIIFKNWNGEELSRREDYHYEDPVTKPSNPSRPMTNVYQYEFEKWDSTVTNVTGDKTYTAVYKESYREYVITFKNWDDTIISTKSDYHYGDTVSLPENDPTKPSNSQHFYKFTGWDKKVTTVTTNITYIAKFEEKELPYTIYYKENTDVIETIDFGSYPQSEVKDDDLKKNLDQKAGNKPNGSTPGNWKNYNYYVGNGTENSGSVEAIMWYCDVEYSNETYRGVYIVNYRPSSTNDASSPSNSYQDENGYYISNIYWFKFEPINWRVLSQVSNDGKTELLLMCNMVIDSQEYYDSNKVRTIESQNVTANNYAESNIRKWLNDNFYNTAFNELQQSIIQKITVDNSARSTNPNNESNKWNNGNNQYSCGNTEDSVFLLSEQEITNNAYGFETDDGSADTTRRLSSTDYAKALGCHYNGTDSATNHCDWWLRSPSYDNEHTVRYVHHDGNSQSSYNVNKTNMGVVPAIIIQLL